MKKLVLAAVMAAVAMAPYSPAVAGEEAPGPGGVLCSFATISDPNTEDGSVQTGYISGGPVFAAGTLRCSIQVGVEPHSGSDAVSVSGSNAGPAPIVVIPHTVVSYVSPPEVPVYLCSEWTDANGTVYFHEDPDPALSHWSADPATPCSLATSA